MYLTRQIQIKKGHNMYAYFENICRLSNNLSNNLYNTTSYYIRQYATSCKSFEEMKPLFVNQMEIFNLVNEVTNDTKFSPTNVNADINDFANILRKVFPKVKQWDSGIVDMPFVANVLQKVVFNDLLLATKKPPLQTVFC